MKKSPDRVRSLLLSWNSGLCLRGDWWIAAKLMRNCVSVNVFLNRIFDFWYVFVELCLLSYGIFSWLNFVIILGWKVRMLQRMLWYIVTSMLLVDFQLSLLLSRLLSSQVSFLALRFLLLDLQIDCYGDMNLFVWVFWGCYRDLYCDQMCLMFLLLCVCVVLL